MSSRLSYFKNVNPTIGLDFDQNQMLNSLSGLIATKAAQADLVSGLAAKADASTVAVSLAAKADKTYVDSQDALKAAITYVDSQDALKADAAATATALSAKASQNTVDALTNTVLTKADKTYVDSQDATKLAVSVHNSRVANEAVFFDAVKNSIYLADASGVEIDYTTLGLTA